MRSDFPADKIISCFYGSSNDCIKVLDPANTVMSFNTNGLKVMEIDDEKEVIGTNWLDFWNGEFRQKAEEALIEAKQGQLARFEGYCPTFKGTMKYWEVSIAPLFGEFGDIQWLLVMSHDATRLKELEELTNTQAQRITELEAHLQAA